MFLQATSGMNYNHKNIKKEYIIVFTRERFVLLVGVLCFREKYLIFLRGALWFLLGEHNVFRGTYLTSGLHRTHLHSIPTFPTISHSYHVSPICFSHLFPSTFLNSSPSHIPKRHSHPANHSLCISSFLSLVYLSIIYFCVSLECFFILYFLMFLVNVFVLVFD